MSKKWGPVEVVETSEYFKIKGKWCQALQRRCLQSKDSPEGNKVSWKGSSKPKRYYCFTYRLKNMPNPTNGSHQRASTPKSRLWESWSRFIFWLYRLKQSVIMIGAMRNLPPHFMIPRASLLSLPNPPQMLCTRRSALIWTPTSLLKEVIHSITQMRQVWWTTFWCTLSRRREKKWSKVNRICLSYRSWREHPSRQFSSQTCKRPNASWTPSWMSTVKKLMFLSTNTIWSSAKNSALLSIWTIDKK